jgi:hypothetical protein
MGAGVAKQAADLYPAASQFYGRWCYAHGAETPVVPWEPGKLIFFPVKPLSPAQPYLSWKNRAELWLVEWSAQ